MELIGRDQELAALSRALACPGSVVVLRGAAGMGKTRLLQEAGLLGLPWVIDDAHRLDDSSLRRITRLCLTPPDDLKLVLSLRPCGADRAIRALLARLPASIALHEIELGPLLPAGLRLPFAGELWSHACGVPLLLVELAQAMTQTPGLTAGGLPAVRRWLETGPLPPRLCDRLLADVLELTEPAQALVRAAAVLGDATDYRTVARVSRMDCARTAAAIAEAVSEGMLHDDGLVRLCTPILGRVIAGSLAPAELQLLHKRAARTLARLNPPPYARLARHAYAAGLRWCHYAERAAETALSGGNPAEAALSGGNAAEAARLLWLALRQRGLRPAKREDLARRLATAAASGLSHHEANAMLSESDTNLSGAVAADLPPLVRGELLMRAGRIAAGRRELIASLPGLAGSPHELGRALSALAVPMWPGEPLARHLTWLRRAVDAFGGRPMPVPVAVNQVTTLLLAGKPEGRQRLSGLLRTAATPEEARGACDHADAAAWLGHYRLADQLLTRAEELGMRVPEHARLRLDWYQGRWEGLAERAERVRADASEVPHAARLEAHLVLGLLHSARGESAAAMNCLAPFADQSDPDIAIPLLVSAAALRADTDAAVKLVRASGNWVWSAELLVAATENYLRDETPDRAPTLITEAAQGLEGRDCPLGRSALAAAEARVRFAAGQPRQAAALHCRAARLYAALPRPYSVAQELAAAGRCLLTIDAERGGRLLQAALARLEQLGATRDASHCRKRLRENGFTVAHRRGRRGYGERLSPRETEVAQLASQGLTNRQIAQALFLSERTVEDHISRAMRKTRVNSRHALGRGRPGA